MFSHLIAAAAAAPSGCNEARAPNGVYLLDVEEDPEEEDFAAEAPTLELAPLPLDEELGFEGGAID